MKLAFSTLGCPGWSWEEIYATAKDLGLDGIEIRGLENEMFAPEAKPFRPENMEKTLQTLAKGRMALPMLTSGADLSDRENRGRFLSEGKRYIDLAEQAGASFVRVLGDRNPAPAGFVDLSLVRSSYLDLCDYAEGKGVQALIETNGVFADSEVMASFLEGLQHPGAGVLWDIHHPWRFFNETPEETLNRIGCHVRYVHIKDSVMKNGQVSYRMLGYGDVPVLDMLRQLNALGYEGYVSLEWVKRWNPDLQEPGVVFSHFTSYMSHLFRAI